MCPKCIMEGSLRSRLILSITVIILGITPIISANPSGLTYLDSTWSTYDAEDGELVDINSNHTIVASVHDDKVILFNSSSLEKIATFPFDRISTIKFSPSGDLLAVNKVTSTQNKDSLKLIDIASLTVLEQSGISDGKAKDIDWSNDGQIIAAPGPDGDVELYKRSDLSVKDTLHSVHNVDVNCIDYRFDDAYVITGDESGRYAVWNTTSEGASHREGDYREYDENLLDCKFTPNGEDIVLLGESGEITSRGFPDWGVIHQNTIEGAKEILFSKSGTRMHVLVESDDFRGLLTYDYDTFSEIKRTTFFHNVEDIAFIEDEYSRLQALYVAGGTGQISVYLRDYTPDGFNEPGADLDGDLVPDNLDPDDDGDGLIDDWDNDIGCDAPDGTPCSQYADLTKIRSIEIDVGEEFTIRDRITLPTEDSSNIRNLSRNAIAVDQKISSHEAQLFADAMCSNMDHGDIIEQWRESIGLSNGKLGEAVVHCILDDGMTFVKIGDSSTQITLSVITTFTYQSNITLPLNITLNRQPLPTDGSIGWLAPSHPIALSFSGKGIIGEEIPMWQNKDGDVVKVELEPMIEQEPTILETALDWALHPIAFVFYLAGIIALGTLWIRRENQIDIDLDDDMDDDMDENSDDDDEDDDDLDEEFENQSDDDSNDIVNDEEPKERPKRTPPSKERTMYTTSPQQSLAKKKKVNPTTLNKDGPIMKTKRKRLIAPEDEPIVAKKKVIVAPVEPKIKKRKVKVVQETVPEEPKKKKRKSVRRKGKTKSKSSKKIDEKNLQDNLVNDFLSED